MTVIETWMAQLQQASEYVALASKRREPIQVVLKAAADGTVHEAKFWATMVERQERIQTIKLAKN